MTVIDVNTGKFIGAGGTLEETVTRNNLEAAEEIVRQLRLRDIGGIVIIDFVDMVLESNRDLVLRRLVECLGRDRTRHQVTEITSLGLVQMTRKRVGEGLVEAFSTTCEACEGRGFIVHQHPVEIQGAAEETPKRSKKAQARARVEESPEHERAREALSAIAAATVRDDSSSHGEMSDHNDQPSAKDSDSGAHEDEASTPKADSSADEQSGVNAASAKRPRRSRRATRPQTEESAEVSTPEEKPEVAPVAQNTPDQFASDSERTEESGSAQPPTASSQSREKPARPGRSRRRRAVIEASEPVTVHLDLPEPAAPVAAVHSVQDIVIDVPARSEDSAPIKRSRRRRVAVSAPAAPGEEQ